MRFISIYRPSKHAPPTAHDMEAMGKFIQDALEAKVLLVTEGFGPSSSTDARLRLANGEITLTDGPFAETKETIGGFAIMQVKTREEMLDWTKRFLLLAGEGEAEVRQLYEMSPIDMAQKR